MGFGPPFMRGEDPEGMGPGMMKGMGHGRMEGHGMMKGMSPGKGMQPGMMHGKAGLGLADLEQLEALKTELKITSAQEEVWSKYAKARESVDPDAVSKMTPAERYAFVSKMREQGQNRFGAVKAAGDELLATLDATQKAKATDILPGFAFGPPMRGAVTGSQHKH
jgi:hypothetical protein